MDGFVLEEKSSFNMLGLTFCSKLDWDSYIISIAKTTFIKIEASIHSMKFHSSEVALYLYKPTTLPYLNLPYHTLPEILLLLLLLLFLLCLGWCY